MLSGDATWQRCSLAISGAERKVEDSGAGALGLGRKLVRARGPHMSRAASS